MAQTAARISDRGRPAILAFCVFTLRIIENWRSALERLTGEPADIETTMIAVAVGAIVTDKFTRTGLPEELKELSSPIPSAILGKCNLASIAEATGINREKVRRKVNKLALDQILQREADGTIRLHPELAARPEIIELAASQRLALQRLIKDTSYLRR